MLGFNPDQQLKKQALKKKGAGKGQQNSTPDLNAENPAIAGGGLIQGPGTGTSDDIQTQMPAGSYIMPADSTEQIGEEGLAGLGSPADVRVSNGEYQLPPEQVHAVGVQALDQMKDATHTPVAKGFNPQVNRDGEQFFNQGGQVLDEEEAKRRAARTPGLAPAGIGLTPEMANANRLAQQRQGGAQAIEQTKANISGAVGQAATSAYNSAMTIPRTIQNTTFDNRLPGQDFRDAKRAAADSARAKQWASANPDQAQQAGLGMQGVADRATAGLNIPPQPLQGIGGAPMSAPQQAAIPTQQTQVDPTTEQATSPQPVADQGAANQPSNDLANTGKADPATGFVDRTDQERRDFARSNKVNGVPTLTSEMARTIDPSSINTMSSKGMMGLLGSQSSGAVSQALKAAADRGDWDAVNRYYRGQGQSFAGMGAPGEGKGTRVTVVRDPTRKPTETDILNQKFDSEQMRIADAARKTDIEGQRVEASIDSDQFRNQILNRQADISSRGQDLAERQAEPTIAQQRRLQALYAEYDAADDAGKARIAQQINQLSGKGDSKENLRNNFLTLKNDDTLDPVTGAIVKGGSYAVDLRTGLPLGQQSQSSQQKQMPPGSTRESIMAEARKKIASGVSRESINNRLAEYGIDPL